ncbi:MAG: hypothetical protein ACI86H_000171 [bacterium]|jgi:uncharacterized protein YchJ
MNKVKAYKQKIGKIYQVFIVICIFGLVSCSQTATKTPSTSSSPKLLVKSYFIAAKNVDKNGMYSLMTNQWQKRTMVSKKSLSKKILAKKLILKSYKKIQQKKIGRRRASIVVRTVILMKGKKSEKKIDFRFVKKGNSWLIYKIFVINISAPELLVESYFTASKNIDKDGMYSLMTNQWQKKADVWKRALSNKILAKKLILKSYKIDRKSIRRKRASIEVKAVISIKGKERKKHISFRFVKKDNSWLISLIG